jgi:hypothetical protein
LRLNWSLLQHINHGFSFLSSLFHCVSSLELCMLWNGICLLAFEKKR